MHIPFIIICHIITIIIKISFDFPYKELSINIRETIPIKYSTKRIYYIVEI